MGREAAGSIRAHARRVGRLLLVTAAAVGCLSGRAAAQPARHALLIGVGKYESPKIRTLDGPRFDVEEIRRELVDNWQFAPARITTLVDEQATRLRILGALDRLVEVTRPGDIVFIFYSGHGTSRQDRAQMHYELHPATGALYPYDTSTASEKSAFESLIVGRRDLRPRFDRLDRDRQVLIVLDSCYSKNATRSLAQPRGDVKAEELFGELQGFSNTASAEPYPYRNIVTLTAASEAEQAIDISYDTIKRGAETIDGNPKGALTDALLRGLRGDANTDDNQALTLGELYQFARERVKKTFKHTPQLLLPEGRAALETRSLFGAGTAPARRTEAISQVLRVRAEGIAPALVRRVETLQGVALAASGPYDVKIVASGGGTVLYHQSGDVIQTFARNDEDVLLQRLERERHARHLIEMTIPSQNFNVRVDIPSKTGVLQSGDEHVYTLTCALDGTAAVLVLNIDKDGFVSTLVPNSPAELSPRAGWTIQGITVMPPEGTEFVKVFAFRTAPPWLRDWVGAKPRPADSAPVRELLANLAAVKQGLAEARLKIVTVGRK